MEQDRLSEIPVFLCYRRADAEWHAEWLYRNLNGCELKHREGPSSRLRVYYDQAAPAVDDWTRIHFPNLQQAKALIVVCTPGIAKDLSKPDKPDWVYKELDWWCDSRNIAPIVIEAVEDAERWIPDPIQDRWPKINRIPLLREEIDAASPQNADRIVTRIINRIVDGIRDSQSAVIFEDLEKTKRLNAELESLNKGLHRLNRRLRVALIAAGAGILVAGILAWIAFERWKDAEESRNHLQLLKEDAEKAFVVVQNSARNPTPDLPKQMEEVSAEFFQKVGIVKDTPTQVRLAKIEMEAGLQAIKEQKAQRFNYLGRNLDVQHFAAASRIYEELQRYYPANVAYRSNACVAMILAGAVIDRDGDHKKAQFYYQYALRMLGRFDEKPPSNRSLFALKARALRQWSLLIKYDHPDRASDFDAYCETNTFPKLSNNLEQQLRSEPNDLPLKRELALTLAWTIFLADDTERKTEAFQTKRRRAIELLGDKVPEFVGSSEIVETRSRLSKLAD